VIPQKTDALTHFRYSWYSGTVLFQQMLWGDYLCGKVPSPKKQCKDKSELVARLEQSLQQLGLSKFSSSVAIQFLIAKIESGRQDKVSRAIGYLLNLLNKKTSKSGCLSFEGDISRDGAHTCPQLIPGLRAQPFWDKSQFSWVSELEAAYSDIKKEFFALREMGGPAVSKEEARSASGFQLYLSPTSLRSTSDLDESVLNITERESFVSDARQGVCKDKLGVVATNKGQWNVCYFFLHGLDFTDNIQRCPNTARSIQSIPHQYNHALFSALAPDTHVKPHCGPTNKKLRCHLPLCIPAPEQHKENRNGSTTEAKHSSAWLRVGQEYKELEEGKCILFDDSFEHEACNPSTSEPRVVLIVDVWHPDLSEEEVFIYCYLCFLFSLLVPLFLFDSHSALHTYRSNFSAL
jgi:aspartate beta-hydroxylase